MSSENKEFDIDDIEEPEPEVDNCDLEMDGNCPKGAVEFDTGGVPYIPATFAPNDPFAPSDERPGHEDELQDTFDYIDIPIIPVVSAEDAANPDIGGGIDVEDLRPKKKRHILRKLLLTFLALVLLCAVGFCGWLYYDDMKNASCHVPQGVTLDGDDIGGLSASEVESRVEKHVLNGTAGGTVLLVGSQEFPLDYAKMGDVDKEATVNAAMATIEPSIFKRCYARAAGLLEDLTGYSIAVETTPVELVTVCDLKQAKVRQRVQAVADQVNKESVEPGYAFNTKKRQVKAHDASTGYKLDVNKTVAEVIRSSESGMATVRAAGEVLLPKKTSPGQAIFVDLEKNQLFFYVEGSVAKQYPCSPGKEGYGTRTGEGYLKNKIDSPVWKNPNKTWSKGMPETIAPGKTNPYGLRALLVNVSGNNYIHGTSDVSKIGTPSTYGTVALSNEDIVELYDLVDAGIPIYIY